MRIILFRIQIASFRIIKILPIALPITQKTPFSCMKTAFLVARRGIEPLLPE
jgi:hypothetical protein